MRCGMVAPESGASPKSTSCPDCTIRLMRDPNRALLEEAAHVLQPFLDELVFLGGCATGLLLTDPAAAGLRATRDVDAITEVVSYAEYDRLSERLRAVGLSEDTTEGAPLCRWRKGTLLIDIMPTAESVLGFTNRWYIPALASAQLTKLGELQIRVITPVYFLATKLEAFRARHELPLGHPRVQLLDLQYHDISRDRSPFYKLQDRGMLERVCLDDDIDVAVDVPPQTTRARLRGEFIKKAKERKRDYTVDWVHLKLNDQAQRTVLCKDPFRSRDERVEKLIASL